MCPFLRVQQGDCRTTMPGPICSRRKPQSRWYRKNSPPSSSPPARTSIFASRSGHTPTRNPPQMRATTSKPTASNPSSSAEVPQQWVSVKDSPRFPQGDIRPRIVSVCVVTRPKSMASAEITSYKLTYQAQSLASTFVGNLKNSRWLTGTACCCGGQLATSLYWPIVQVSFSCMYLVCLLSLVSP